MDIRDPITRRFGEMALALCEAETVIAERDKRIKELEEAIKKALEVSSPKSGAEEMMENR